MSEKRYDLDGLNWQEAHERVMPRPSANYHPSRDSMSENYIPTPTRSPWPWVVLALSVVAIIAVTVVIVTGREKSDGTAPAAKAPAASAAPAAEPEPEPEPQPEDGPESRDGIIVQQSWDGMTAKEKESLCWGWNNTDQRTQLRQMSKGLPSQRDELSDLLDRECW